MTQITPIILPSTEYEQFLKYQAFLKASESSEPNTPPVENQPEPTYEAIPEEFYTSSYTIEDFVRDTRKTNVPHTLQYYVSLAVKCIALVSTGEFIIKSRYSSTIEYQPITKKDLEVKLEYDCLLKLTDDDIANNKAKHKSSAGSKLYPIKMILRHPALSNCINSFDRYCVISNDSNVFSLRRPPDSHLCIDPEITYKRESPIKFIDFMQSRILNPESFIDLLDTIKMQIKRPQKKACRFYTLFDPKGGAGKSFCMLSISKLYGSFAFTNVTPKSMKDKFNDWLENRLFVSFEEAENESYTDKAINTFVKQWTSNEISIRGMYKTSRAGTNYAIGMLASNDAGLYGLARSDAATKRRIVNMLFKENDVSQERWDDMINLVMDKSFGYSFYKYMYEEYTISPSYNSDRYSDKYNTWQYLQSLKKNSIETFVELLDRYNGGGYGYGDVNYDIVKIYKGAKIQYAYIDFKDFQKNFKTHQQLGNNKPMTVENAKVAMNDLGWKYNAKKKMDGHQLAVFYREDDKYINDDDDELSSEEYGETEEIDAETEE
jgi:hypothetical protein